MRRVVFFSIFVVVITSTVLLARLYYPWQLSPPQETIHIALGANMLVVPGLVTTMWSVQQHTRAPGRSLTLSYVPPSPLASISDFLD